MNIITLFTGTAYQGLPKEHMFPGRPYHPYGNVVSHGMTYRHLGANVDLSFPKVGGYYVIWRWESNNETFNFEEQFSYTTSNWKTSYGTLTNYGGPSMMLQSGSNYYATPYYAPTSWKVGYPMSLTCGANSKQTFLMTKVFYLKYKL